MTISEDLRLRVVQKVSSGMSRRQAAAHFDVSVSSAIRFVKQHEEEGSVAPRQRRRYKRRLDPYSEDILLWIKQTPDLTLGELSDRLLDVHEIEAATSTIDDWLRAHNISFKKNRTRQ
jgi:transposase